MKTIDPSSILSACLAVALPIAMAEQYYGGANYGYTSSIYGTNAYADSSATYYDAYAQAWRYLGWYVDCNGGSDRYYSRSGGHGGSHSEDQSASFGNNYCQRYLMWAAYVDEAYSGGGIGEYAIFDTNKGSYDSTACDTHGTGSCKYMDCHDPASTNWKLMGVFKEASYFGNDAFFEQLFKHEGVCVWNDDSLYEFMSETRESSWSSGCLSTGISYGQSGLYIDLKPTFNGNMTYALYTDYVCATEYEGNDYNVESVAANMGLLYGSYMEAWNDAMEPFKVCQPCRAYNLQQTSSSNSKQYSSSSSSRYGSWRYTGNNGGRDLDANLQSNEVKGDEKDSETSNRRLENENGNGWYNDDDGYDPNNGYFRCDDDADYSNVNQCMKFRSHADLEPATWEDLVAATNQGGILTVNVSGVLFGSPFVSKEQEEYLTYVRRQKEAAFAKELEAKAAKAVASAPTAQSALVIGQLWIGFGAVAFTFSLFRLTRQVFCLEKGDPTKLSEPLSKDETTA
mmetsp:Transcript_2464/g.5374  ORF Transcript_2464/g.5374 Transcript_2464/m.5374 type:complete len:511 (-) Transcript_2464:215-1747(-)|eukprot:CAMPEP_0168185160 /NCGR_PEP_ID=MMETSP0139_2-20121125/13676_1 /TAXON_ID=44445 /ORGANISM="Pseudo-nitzschia australis, Strain 10249 10 AB" /LENGTH=510 /DNA_ID=CAMNT_0008106933 /DNA_START=72 /DNA_END=1604 /DNA_ORIENTATION=+